MNTPSDVASQVLDAIGSDFVLGDISSGSREAQVLLRAYLQCLQQLLRSANWDFSRKTTPLLMLADRTGQTPNVGTVVPSGYQYEYAYPTDCMKIRFISQHHNFTAAIPSGNIQIAANTPLMPNLGPGFPGAHPRPARFVIATDSNYPVPNGGQGLAQGVGQSSRTVVLTDVKDAHATYTALILEPSQWDSLFRAALVAYLASEVALPLSKDKKFGLAVRGEQIQIAKMKLEQARLVDGNEGTTSSDITVDWMQGRRSGGSLLRRGGHGGGGEGFNGGGGWDSLSFADGSAY